jgi:hypothetical protein
MSSLAQTFPYAVSTGSSFTAFDKLQAVNNYIPWKKNMRTVLQSLQQWGMVTGTVQAPVASDVGAPTADETRTTEASEVRRISAFMEISFRMADSAETVLGNTEDPKVAWELLEKHYGAMCSSKGRNTFSWRNYSQPSGMASDPPILTVIPWSTFALN